MSRRRRGSRWVLRSLLLLGALAAGRLPAQTFVDDFERPDGALDGDGWTVHAGLWALEGGALRAGPASPGTEQHAYVGSPAARFPIGEVSLSVDMQFRNGDEQPVGRHAGVLLCMDPPAARSASSGYLVWYIDRLEDRGINLARRDGGAFTKLVSGSFAPDQGPPVNLRVEIAGPTIRAFADDVEVLAFDDATYRGGHFGLWTWDGAGQDVEFDDFRLEVTPDPLVACFEVTPTTVTAGADVIFDAGCTQATGAVSSFAWDFGDGDTATGEVVEHAYQFSDNYVVALTVTDTDGHVATAERLVAVTDTLLKPDFTDDFDRGPGPVEGWTAFPASCESICWDLTEDGRLHGASSGEVHIWAGDPAGLIQGDVTIDFEIEFSNRPADGVGRHAGVFFFARDPISRWDTASYNVWWIDRAQDLGLGLLRWDPAIVPLQHSKDTLPELLDPPARWTITVEGPRIRVYGDALLVLDVEDDTHPREGHFGFWAYSNGQDVLLDNVSVRSGVFPPQVAEIVPCARAAPAEALVGEEVTFDASCSRIQDGVPPPAYLWDFGDGSAAEGEVVTHAYDFADSYVVTLTIEPESGPAAMEEITVEVTEVVELPVVEDFSLPAGPAVPGWTVSSGDWSITEDGALLVETAGAEAHIWYGDPPALIGGDVRIGFDVAFESHDPPGDAVGRHAGVFFFSADPISRWDTEAYDVWWIDREQDFGLGLHRWPLAFLSPGTCPLAGPCAFPDLLDPPSRWRIEVDGTRLRVFGDGELLVDVEDGARRLGHVGFWAYSNGQRVRFDNLCIESDSSPCGGAGVPYIRGDTNADGGANIADASYLLNRLFLGGPDFACEATADTNGDQSANIADASYLLNFLFLGGPPLPPPGACGEGPSADAEACRSYAPCD